jgi:hypothetical protein
MKYFTSFPSTKYLAPNKQTVEMVNIFDRPEIKTSDLESYNADSDQYFVQDTKTPEEMSNEIYGDRNYFWVILVSNKIIDFYREWPVSSYELSRELYETNATYTFYTLYNMEIKKNDIIVKANNTSSMFDDGNYGVVLDSNKFLRSFDVQMIAGDLKEGDEYYVLRPIGKKYSIISTSTENETQILKKRSLKLESGVEFLKADDNTRENIFVSPYQSLEDSSLISDQISNLNSESGIKTILYNYINNTLSPSVTVVTFMEQKQRQWVSSRVIKAVPNNLLGQFTNAYNSSVERLVNQ